MSLDQIITVQITRTGTSPTEEGFGTPLIAGYFPTSIFPQRVKEYSSLTEMVSDGFVSTDPVYLAAADCLAQNPSPPTIKVGRRANAPQQTMTVTPTDLTVGSVHSVSVVGFEDSAFASRTIATDTASYTVTAGNTATDVCNGLRAAFAALNGAAGQAGDWADGGTATLTITASNTTMDGMLFGVTYTVNGDSVGVDDLTPDPGIEADLTAILAYDPDWYGLCLDSNSRDEIWDEVADAGAAKWAEANDKLLVCQTQDVLVASNAAETSSIAYHLKNSSFDNTMLFCHRNNRDYVAAAMLGRALPTDAGSITWAYKQLAGVSSQGFTTSEQGVITGKNANMVTTLAGIATTRYGTMASGEFADIIRGTAWLASRIQTDVYAALLNAEKVPYTDGGLQMLRGVILGRLQDGVARDFLAADPEPTVTVPRASTVLAALKAARTVDPITFRATLSGAVHKVAIDGQLVL